MTPNPSAVPTVQIDDATVRVTEWRFAPGATTGWHRHEYPYVVVPMTTGRQVGVSPLCAQTSSPRVMIDMAMKNQVRMCYSLFY